MSLSQIMIDPNQLARVGDLELLARTVVQGMRTGVQRGPKTGSSVEFSQYRPYAQGDDTRLLDWKLYGRTDRLHLKQFREETGMRCTILLDCSASMAYGSGQVTKFDYARMLAACLTTILNNQGDAIGLAAYHKELVSHIPPAHGDRHFRKVLVELADLQPRESTDTRQALRFLGEVLRPRGMVVLISDLLQPVEEVVDHLKTIRARRHDVIVLRICDLAEKTFSFKHAITLIDAETGDEQFVVPDSIRDAYQANRRRHFETIDKEAWAHEIDIQEFSSDQPLDHVLRHFIHHRNRSLMTSGYRRNR